MTIRNLFNVISPVLVLPTEAPGQAPIRSQIMDLRDYSGFFLQFDVGAFDEGANITLSIIGGDSPADCIHVLDTPLIPPPQTGKPGRVVYDFPRLTEAFVRFEIKRGGANLELLAALALGYGNRGVRVMTPEDAESLGLLAGALIAGPERTGEINTDF